MRDHLIEFNDGLEGFSILSSTYSTKFSDPNHDKDNLTFYVLDTGSVVKHIYIKHLGT